MIMIAAKNLLNAVCALMVACSFAACSTVTDEDTSSVMMELNTAPQSTATSKAASRADADVVPGKVLFFTGSAMGTFYHYSDIADLNSYTTAKGKYNTGYTYPSDASTVYALGYAPYDANTIACSSDYSTLTLTDDNAGIVDVMTSNSVITGSKDVIFADELDYGHTLTKITFVAMRDATMENIRKVYDVELTIPASYMPNKWVWNTTDSKYELSTTTRSKDRTLVYAGYLPETGVEYPLGVLYVKLDSSNKGVILKGITDVLKAKFLHVGNTEDKTVQFSSNLPEGIQLYDAAGTTAITNPQPGEAYKVIFSFTNDSFILKAVKVDWEQGSLITIPVN
jgi:hypothetical protein